MIQDPKRKYIPFVPIKRPNRTWPDKQITHPPIWCSVDLRDGNQALVDPMNVQEKLELFHTLVDIGVKEIEVASPLPPRQNTNSSAPLSMAATSPAM